MQRGFTLIELLIVIAILAIAASMAVPRINDWVADRDLDVAARELAADIRLLQQMTVNSGGVIPIMKFKISSPYGYYTSLSPNGSKPSRDFPATLTLSVVSPNELKFGMSGMPTSPKTITITRTDGKGSKQVIIDSVGRVRIE